MLRWECQPRVLLAPTPDVFRTTRFERTMHKLPRRLAYYHNQLSNRLVKPVFDCVRSRDFCL